MKPGAGFALALTTLVAVAALSASAAEPAYRAASQPGGPGYFSEAADKGRFTVGYTGDKSMSRAKVAQFALLRAAEFTTESGQEWFAVLSTKTQSVPDTTAASSDDLTSRSGHFMGTGGQEGGSTGVADSPGAIDNSSSFGGPLVPNGVLERWRPPTVYQTVLLIQMGSGDKTSFEGVKKAPQIFSAKDTSAELRAKLGAK